MFLDPSTGVGNSRDEFLRSHPFWMDMAKKELGTKEVAGTNTHNARIQEYLRAANTVAGDETAWCSAFVNWVMQQYGYSRTVQPNARSWTNWGKGIPSPRYGCIVVLWREIQSSWKGHVGFYYKSDSNNIWLLGGNQGNKVCVQSYPANRLLGYRWPFEKEYDAMSNNNNKGDGFI